MPARRRHLLIVSYYFPPMGGVPVRRVLRFLRHLPAKGWRCSVLTADRPYDPFHPSDLDVAGDVPPAERIVRVPAKAWLERALSSGFRSLARLRDLLPSREGADVAGGDLRRRLYDGLLFPDPKKRWIRPAVAAGLELAREDPVDALLATGYPWSCFAAAHELGAALERPVVLDFRDAWTANPRRLWVSPRHLELERRLVERSALVTAATDWIRDDLRERHPGTVPIETVANGYDPAEWSEPDADLVDPERLVLTYTGTFNDALPPSRFDQSPYYLIEAIARLEPELRRRLRVRLVGRIPRSYRRWIAKCGLEGTIECIGPVSHRRALQHQRAADLLLLVVCDAPGAAGVRTLKLAEYVGAGRPILALAPEGEAARIVRERRLGWVAPPTDVRRIASLLRDLARRPAELRRGGRSSPPPDALRADRQVSRLAELLDGIDRHRPAGKEPAEALAARSAQAARSSKLGGDRKARESM